MKRVVITGLGGITPVGNSLEEISNNIFNGKSGIGFVTKMDTTEYKSNIAGEVKNFDPKKYIDSKELKRLDMYSVYAIAAAMDAYADSGIDSVIDKNRFATAFGSGIGGLVTIEENARKLFEKGPKRVSPLFIPMSIPNMGAGNVAIALGAKGACKSVTTACAAGTDAVIEAYRIITEGRADAVIAGGSEAPISGLGVAGFGNMTALTSATELDRASIPFDKERSGFVMAEGGAALLVEELEHALKRNANIYAEIVGFGNSCDAFHITSPNKDGGVRCMEEAIKSANITKDKIAYINAHGTSTPQNDLNETLAIKEVFKDYTKTILVSSTKSMTGHMLGAAGAMEALICSLALQKQLAPPTINYKVVDEELDLDYVPAVARRANLEYVMSNSLGFGGHNSSLILKRWNNE